MNPDSVTFPEGRIIENKEDTKFGPLGTGALALGIISVFIPGFYGMAVAFGAAVLGYLGFRKRERLSKQGIILAGIVLIFLNLQGMGIIPPRTRDNGALDQYARAIRSSWKVFHAVKALNAIPPGKERNEKTKRLLDAIDETITEARKVQVDTLDAHMPGFAKHFRDNFIEGLRHLKAGYAKPDQAEQTKGGLLLDKWGKWSRKNRQAFKKLWKQGHESPSLFRTMTGV